MVATLSCPKAEQIEQLLLGRLGDEETEAFERHIESCDICSRLLPSVKADDSLVEAMRTHRSMAFAPSDQSTVNDLTARLHELSHLACHHGSGDAGRPTKQPVEFDIRTLLGPPQADDELGRLGPYRVIKLLGQGGMGAVFLAEDQHLQRTVALKVMLPDVAQKAAAREHFLREARAAAQIEHDHIVTIYQVGEDHGVPFVAMPWLRGASLEDMLRQRKEQGESPTLPVPEILRIGREIAAGLAAAHLRGLVHRDIKPANIWLDASAAGRVKILDFGLVQPVDEDSSQAPRMIAGTAAFMSPEQARNEKIDSRADLFSLGCVLYRLCTGQLPWHGSDAVETLLAIATEKPVPVRDRNAEIPPQLAELVMQLLATRREDRPESAQLVVERLSHIGHSVSRRSRRNMLVGLAAFLILPLAAALIYVQTDAGMLAIETTGEDVQVVVEQNGKVIDILDKKQGTKIRLHSGEYQVRLDEPQPNVQLDRDRIRILRGETTLVTVRKVNEPSLAQPGNDKSIVNSIGMKLAFIPAGSFLMGSPQAEPNRVVDEFQHQVTITKPFCMGAYCVTVGQFRQFIEATNFRPEGGDAWKSPGFEQTDEQPVGNVSWFDAVAFCEWLTKKEGREYRLPTEAEWEYACRAGTQTAYFFGDDPKRLLEYAYAGKVTPGPVAPLKPNPWGLYHMYGNQWQWTADWYGEDYYRHSPKEDPRGPDAGECRVQRGSSQFMVDQAICRSAYRHGNHPPSYYKPHAGFRVVLADGPQE